MSELPEGWAACPLAELGSWYGGGTPSKSKPEYWVDGTIPWVSPKDMKTDRIRTTADSITETALSSSATKLVPPGSVLMVVRSGILAHTFPVALSQSVVTLNQDMKALSPEVAIPEFTFWGLRSHGGRILDECSKTGTTVASVNSDQLLQFELPLPPLNEQRRIVDKIEALTARSRRAKEALDAVPALLDKLRQSILASAFRGDLTADWRAKHPDVEPASVLLERIRTERRRRWEEATLAKLTASGKPPKNDTWKAKYQEPASPDFRNGQAQLPDRWVWASVSELTECLDSARVPVTRKDRTSGPYPYYGANGQVDSIDKYLFDEELVLVTEDETFYGRTKPIAYRVSGKCWVNNHAHVLRVESPLPVALVHFALMHYPITPWLSGSTGRAKLTQGDLNCLPIALPPLEEISAMVANVGATLRIANALATTPNWISSELTQLDSSILAKAFRGELVPQDPNDEPASVLLERIRAERESGRTKQSTKKRSTKRKPAK